MGQMVFTTEKLKDLGKVIYVNLTLYDLQSFDQLYLILLFRPSNKIMWKVPLLHVIG